MQRRCQLVDERDLLNAQLDNPEKESFRRPVFSVSLWMSLSQFVWTHCSEFDQRKNRGIVGCFREEEEEVAIELEEMVEVARVELAS